MKNAMSLAICFIFMGILSWKTLRKLLLGIVILMIIMDSTISTISSASKMPQNKELVNTMNESVEIADQRIALLDLSINDAYPSYYLTYYKPEKG